MTRLFTEFGIGTSLKHRDYTEAALRGIKDALWRNSINFAEILGKSKSDMILEVEIAVQSPSKVDVDKLVNAFPYGKPRFSISKGGLDVWQADSNIPAVIANVAISLSFEAQIGSQ